MARPSDWPDDAALTREGWSAGNGGGRVRLIACGALAREILALIEINGWHHMDLKCLPAILHNHPDQITPRVEIAISEARAEGYEQIFVVYADCGTGGGLERLCEAEGVGLVPGPHCYAFFDGLEAFTARGEDEMRCFYLTDFLVRQFDAFVWEPLGLDRHPELRDMYFSHYETLVYLAQIESDELTQTARGHAARLGLKFEHRATGYGDLPNVLGSLGH